MAANTENELLRRLAVLREEALQLVSHCADNQDPAPADLIVALQDASNSLGRAQAALTPSAPITLAPAPIEPGRRRATGHRKAPNAAASKPITAEAAIVLGLAEFTVPFAGTRQDEAERWLRVLRQEGQAGAALQALGIDAPQLATRAEPRDSVGMPRGQEAVRAIREQATDLTRERGGNHTTTLDVLFAVIVDYGPLFDRSLYAAGATRVELLDELHGRASVAQAV